MVRIKPGKFVCVDQGPILAMIWMGNPQICWPLEMTCKKCVMWLPTCGACFYLLETAFAVGKMPFERDQSGCGATRPFRQQPDEGECRVIEHKPSLMSSGTLVLLLPLFLVSFLNIRAPCPILFVLTLVYRHPDMSFHRLYTLTTTLQRAGKR